MQVEEIEMSTATLRSAVVPRATALSDAVLLVIGVATLALLAQISLPIPGSPVPVTGQTLGVLLIGTAYGARLGGLTFATYLAAGVAGAPIFAPSATSANHGIERLVGATGGYLIGMLLASYALGFLAERRLDQKFTTSFIHFLIGSAITFSFGLLWLQHYTDKSWSWTLGAGLTPFIVGEVVKIAIAGTSLPLVWRFLSRR